MIEKYIHHDAEVFVDSRLKGKHRDHCLCYKCVRFQPGTEDNCIAAQTLYNLCCLQDMVTPVYECPSFQEAKHDVE